MNLENSRTDMRPIDVSLLSDMKGCDIPTESCKTDMIQPQHMKSSTTLPCEKKLKNGLEDSNVTDTPFPSSNLSGEKINSESEKTEEDEPPSLNPELKCEDKTPKNKSVESFGCMSQQSGSITTEIEEFIKTISDGEAETSDKTLIRNTSSVSSAENNKDLGQKVSQEKRKDTNTFGEARKSFLNTHDKIAESQEMTLQYLYDTIKCTVGPLFDRIQWVAAEKKLEKGGNRKEKTTKSVQQKYEIILQEISEVWRNTITLIRSVKEHTVQFLDKRDTNVDREQLILEAEMMQLAIDFAVNYSKLKSYFFIKKLAKTLNINSLEKSDLENFLDSKTFAAVYSSDDLNGMAQTVEDLTKSVLRTEDFEIE